MKTSLFYSALLVVLFQASHADAEPPNPASSETRLMLETDPATFVLDGFAVHSRLEHPRARGWSLGLGLYSLEYPSLLVELDPENRDEGWRARMRIGYGAFLDRHFGTRRSSPFVGVQLAVQRFELARDKTTAPKDLAVGLAMARLGYRWFPTDAEFYVMPWAGAGVSVALSEPVEIDNETYNVRPLTLFATAHVGWRF